MEQNHVSKSSKLKSIPSCLMKMVQNLKRCTCCTERESEGNPANVHEDKNQNEELLSPPEELVLADLPSMVYLWRLEHGIPVFKNLRFLEFVHCSELKTLFSISMAENLEQLELLKLYNCGKMEHVLHGNEGSAKVLVFKKLKQLILKHLPNLESFYEEDCEFVWPKLEMVRVKNIPKMNKFAKGAQETPNLKEFYITYVSNCWQGDLNETIEYLHKYPDEEKAGYKNFELIQLKPQTVRDSSAEAVAKGKEETRVEDSTAVGDEIPATPSFNHSPINVLLSPPLWNAVASGGYVLGER